MISEYFDNFNLIASIAAILIVVVILIVFRMLSFRHQINDLRIRIFINQHEQLVRHQLLLEQFKQQPDKLHALTELEHIFEDKIRSLRNQYPALTDLDAQVVTLIGLGVENHEIITITNMSKRTYYKRRQLISKRMQTTAALLDTIAKQIFTTNH